MKWPSLRIPWLAFLVSAACCSAGCETHHTNPPSDIQSRMSGNLHPALRGSVMEFADLVDSAPMRVEGWGIVAGLPNTGSPIMDPRIHELMMNRLLTLGIGSWTNNTQDISPEAILASSQISIVEVRGAIPPLARRGSTFDLFINAIPGSGTTSIANGLLWRCDLKLRGLTVNDDDTRTIAEGRGPVFIPAPLEAEADVAAGAKSSDTRKVMRSGRVIAGGVCAEDRDARLQLYAPPDWMRTRLIERAIVAHFPGREKPAAAVDSGIIELHIPPEYRDNPMDFVDLARHLYFSTEEPGFIERKAAELIAALKDPASPHRDLGLALQGLGRSILPDYLQPNYTAQNLELRYWCARAGACLQDVQGLATLEEMVRDPGNPLRRRALLAMIEASRGRDTERATLALYEMIRSFNVDDRILAYHALLAIRSRAVSTYNVGHKFMLDIIPADCPPLIYVLEADSPRIAFIGRDLSLPQGATVLSRDRLLTIVDHTPDSPEPAMAPVLLPGMTASTKPKEKETVLLYWRSPLGDKEETLFSGPGLPAIVARACWVPDPLAPNYDPSARYIGVSYQRITEILAGMCADKTIDATFIVERTPDLVVSPTDQALSIRPEGSTRMTPADTPKPPSDAPGALDGGTQDGGTPQH